MTDRISRDQLGLLLAHAWSLRGTCARRRVGCVLMDADGRQLSAGYNGPPSGWAHCTEQPCRGADYASGEGLDECVSVHSEQNAIAFCPDVRLIDVAYVTVSPCIPCMKLFLNTGCRRIVFAEPYAHREAGNMWMNSSREGLVRTWEHVPFAWRIRAKSTFSKYAW